MVVAGARRHRDEPIADLDGRIAALEAELAAVLKEGNRAASLACLTGAPGVGLITAAWLLVSTRDFALAVTPAVATAYAGPAPMPRESGRTARYLANHSAARHNPAIHAFSDRLRAAGKPTQVARCAAARKLLHLAWALVTRQQRYDPTRQQQQLATPTARAATPQAA